jgi:SAM-dependent methyltransferase
MMRARRTPAGNQSSCEPGEILTDADGHAFRLAPIACPTCGISDLKEMGYRGGSQHHRYGHGVPTRIVRCTRCGLIFPQPFPYPLAPTELYGDPDKYFERTDLHGDDTKLKGYREIVREVLKRSRTPTPALLDVGSGRGHFLEAATLEGIVDPVGLELAPAMVDEARRKFGVEVMLETIEEHAERSGRTYDVIILAGVLEHVYDPDSMIAAAARLSSPGTLVFLDLPVEPCMTTVVGNLANRITGSRSVYNLSPTWPPYHVFGFNPDSLRILLNKHYFDVEGCRVWAAPRIPAQGGLPDRAKAFLATQLNRLANLTGTAANMHVWARFTPPVTDPPLKR